MCLAVPGKLLRWIDRDPILAVADIEFGGVRRACHMACVPTAREGDYVIVHAGIAISIIDAAQADRLLQELAALPAVSDDPFGPGAEDLNGGRQGDSPDAVSG
jgi:hydrogenase expression/formation protein HypC